MAEAKVIISADASKHVSEMNRAGKSVKDYGDKWKGVKDMAIGQMLGNLASKAASAAIDFAKSGASFAIHMAEMKDQTGMAVEDIQAFIYMAQEAGLEAGDAEALLIKMGNAFYKLADPTTIADLKKLGMSMEDIRSVTDRTDFIEKLAKAMANAGDETKKLEAAFGFFGKGGTRFEKLMKDVGGIGFEEAKQKYKNIIISGQRAEQIHDLNLKKERLEQRATKVMTGGDLALDKEKTRKEEEAKQQERKRLAEQHASIQDPEEVKQAEKIAKIEAKAKEDITDLQTKSMAKGGSTADQLQKIGGGFGGISTFNARVADRQLQEAIETKQILSKMADDISQIRKDPAGGYE